VSDPSPALPPASPAAIQGGSDLAQRHDGGRAGWRDGLSDWLAASPVALPLALVAAVVVGLTVGLLVAGLPSDWRAASLIGAILAAGALGLGAPLMARSRRELDAARHLLDATAGELVRVNDDLRRTAAARDLALSELRASVEERQLFLNSIAHELNSPLTVVKGHVQLIAGRLARDEPPARDQLVRGFDRIGAGVQQLAGLVEEFLWLARLDIAEPVTLDRRPTDLVALVRGVAEERQASTARHTIRVDATSDRLVGRWDDRRLGRAIGSLIVNAINYSPHGGEILVTVVADPANASAIVSVHDRGIGVAANDLPYLFDRFYRGELAKQVTAGTGLGLTAVRHTVEAHGGSVAVENRPGGGASFTIDVPLHTETEVAEAPMPEPPPAQFKADLSEDRH
jgi:signal transduction histidine kinase